MGSAGLGDSHPSFTYECHLCWGNTQGPTLLSVTSAGVTLRDPRVLSVTSAGVTLRDPSVLSATFAGFTKASHIVTKI